ncbi:MAG: aldo/keto reductase [Halosimplex sp.]
MGVLPDIGFGTYTITDREACIDAVSTALEAGYRYVDTAQVYDNEAAVGEGIARADVPREEVVVGTKLHWERLGYEETIESALESRERLGVETIDLLYVHWPIETYDPEETLPALDELVDRGVVDRIGVCNFSEELLETARERLEAPLAVHQIERHPLLTQESLVSYARETGHRVVAAVPLGRGAVLERPEVRSVAANHDLTPAQVALAWQIRRGVAPIPKARGDHILENYAAVDAASALDESDLDLLDGIEERRRIVGGWPGAHWKQD